MTLYCIIMSLMWKVTENKNILLSWVFWHYITLPKEIFFKWKNVFLFMMNYFSLSLLFRTYFSPWRRYQWSHTKGFDLQKYFEVMISNLFSRVMGSFMRTFLIIFAVISEIFVVIVGSLIFLFWIFMPFLFIFGILIIF